MEQITIGQIAIAVAFLTALIGGVGGLVKSMKGWIHKAMKEQLDEIGKGMKDLGQRIDAVDMQATKNFLVSMLSDVEKGKPMDDIEAERFWEEYEHYSKIGGNSYIKRKVEQLKSEGKI